LTDLARVRCINAECNCAEKMPNIIVTQNACQVNCPHTDINQHNNTLSKRLRNYSVMVNIN